ncbi:MAG: Zn-ribbon domain-containing OB-fold protein [Geminicoccaceae bacterium]|uniref:Zn-ribbon domain-containing OB-fold protein n=1 Tax=Reyranella sp. TaxID=1929291 RepID=UPI003D0EB7C1
MKRPLPSATAETRPFWDGCSDGELRYQACGDCGTVQPIPRSFCSHCQSRRLDWKRSSAVGTVLSFTVVQRAPTAAFRAEVPYAIVLVDVDEGFRLMVNSDAGLQPTLAIGQKVRIGFKDVEGVKLPHAEALP